MKLSENPKALSSVDNMEAFHGFKFKEEAFVFYFSLICHIIFNSTIVLTELLYSVLRLESCVSVCIWQILLTLDFRCAIFDSQVT